MESNQRQDRLGLEWLMARENSSRIQAGPTHPMVVFMQIHRIVYNSPTSSLNGYYAGHLPEPGQ